MQGRRLQRQLEAAKRRQAGAQAAADAAAVAAATRHSAGEMHVNARETTRDPGGANPARRVDRALAVRRRRAMLQGEMVRLTIEALKRKGERRAQSLLQEIGNAPRSDGAAGGKVHASGAAAAILASASITEGVGSRAMGKAAAGKGAVLGGGPPRSMESWSQQVSQSIASGLVRVALSLLPVIWIASRYRSSLIRYLRFEIAMFSALFLFTAGISFVASFGCCSTCIVRCVVCR